MHAEIDATDPDQQGEHDPHAQAIRSDPGLGLHMREQGSECEVDHRRQHRVAAWEARQVRFDAMGKQRRSGSQEQRLQHNAENAPPENRDQNQPCSCRPAADPQEAHHDRSHEPHHGQAAEAREVAKENLEPRGTHRVSRVGGIAQCQQHHPVEGICVAFHDL